MQQEITPREILQQAFPGIDRQQIDEMIASCHTFTYPAGRMLCKEGEYENIFYIILSGKVEVTKRLHMGEERVLKHLSAGSFFGEMAVIQNVPRTATVTTMEPTTVLEIHYDSFQSLIERNKSVSLAVIREISRRLRENDEMAIEELRMKARDLAAAYQQLAEEEYARNQFLTTVAHELRTPLMAANGYLQVIRMGMVEGKELDIALETVWRNLQEITSHTNDILFLQEIDLIPAEFRSTDIGEVIREAIQQKRTMSQQIGVEILLNIEPGLPMVKGNPKSLQRAFEAILDNAIKFSPDGGEVNIRAAHIQDEIRVEVEDKGVGIPADAMPRIFQRFFHLDIICDRVFRGMGLGLSIAKQVIEQHGGAITVKSELGKGSTFLLRFKINK
jgi:signal transduction histidine kinase